MPDSGVYSFMPQPSDSNTPKSDYPELQLPPDGWKSNIPEHLLANCDPQTLWLMQEMSRNTQATEWNSHAAIGIDSNVRKTNGRLKGAERNIIGLQEEMKEMKIQMRAMKPIIGPLSTIRVVFSYKIAWFVLLVLVLAVAGVNREAVVRLVKLILMTP